MSAHVRWEDLVDYWADDLEHADALEEHLMGCQACSVLSARVAELSTRLREIIPPLLTPELLRRLQGRGLCIVENPMQPGEQRQVLFPAAADVLLQRLGGVPEDVVHVGFRMTAQDTGQVLLELADAPFDRASNSVLVACQHHFRDLPNDVVATLDLTHADGSRSSQAYTIRHVFEQGR